MSVKTRQELLEALRPQYLDANRKDKKQLLDGFVTATGYNRKHAIVLIKAIAKKIGEKRQRKKFYDDKVWEALVQVWRAGNRICSKRLVPFLADLVEALERFGHISLEPETRTKLLSLSAATADRLLAVERKKYGSRGKSTTRPGYLLKKQIAIRTFTDWNDTAAGFLEGDLVAHCGESVSGQFLNTLTVTDIATGWTELGALLGKSEADVMQSLCELRELLPFPLLGIDTDNGSEFINHTLFNWCRKNSITFTRSRPYKKNDQAHVEEKNGSIVRRLTGYDRYEGVESWQLLSSLYRIARLYINFFQPSVKLIAKNREGGHVRKKYEPARTPYRRVLELTSITEEKKVDLRKLFNSLDPVLLLNEIERLQAEFWSTAVKNNVQLPAINALPSPVQSITIAPVGTTKQRIKRKRTRTEQIISEKTGKKAGRKTNLDEVWNEICQELERTPSLTPREIMQILATRYPGKFRPTQYNTVRDKLLRWRQTNSINLNLPKAKSGRKTNVDAVWNEVCQELEKNPTLGSGAIISMLCERYPGKFRPTQKSTIKGRLKKWRKSYLERVSPTVITSKK